MPRYEADSLAKTMTAQVVGVAVSQGLIDLDKPLLEYGVQPRCAGSGKAEPPQPPPREQCVALLRRLCPHVAPPFDCVNGWSAWPRRPTTRACSQQCLGDPNVTKALRESNCSGDARTWCRDRGGGADACWVDCVTGKSHYPKVTARHLLSQTTGVGVYAPGTAWTYDSDQYIDHLAYLVSKVTNESSATWATREYAVPMGLPPDLFAYDGFTDPVDGPEFSPGGCVATQRHCVHPPPTPAHAHAHARTVALPPHIRTHARNCRPAIWPAGSLLSHWPNAGANTPDEGRERHIQCAVFAVFAVWVAV